LTANIAKEAAKFAEKIFPKVPVETPAPPALRKGAHWKGDSRRGGPACLFSFLKQLLAIGS
jgi:hypothetical protein